MLLVISKSFFIMSIFDPQSLYHHSTRYTKKGQVQQKRPIHRSTTVSSTEIEHSALVLKNFQYKIYPPLPKDYKQYVVDLFDLRFAKSLVGQQLLDNSFRFDIEFWEVWPFIATKFVQTLDFPLSQVESCIFNIYIHHLEFQTSLPSSVSWNIQTYNRVPVSSSFPALDLHIQHLSGFHWSVVTPYNTTGAALYMSDGSVLPPNYINRPDFPFLGEYRSYSPEYLSFLQSHHHTPIDPNDPNDFHIIMMMLESQVPEEVPDDAFITLVLSYQATMLIVPKSL